MLFDKNTHGNAVPIRDRFWKFVDKAGPDDCWLWNGARSRERGKMGANIGYGKIKSNGKMYTATRVLWEMLHGPIPEGMNLLHKCDNTLCVNPNHLFLGTCRDNIIDAVKKGRIVGRKGENCNLTKLTEAQVLEMRKEYDSGNRSLIRLARKYGVRYGTVWRTVTRQSWQHLP